MGTTRPDGAAHPHRDKDNMPFYEHIIISRPDIAPAQVEATTAEYAQFLQENGAKVSKTEYWGLRNLAYPINKQRKAHYALLNIDGPPAAVQEMERRHRLSDDVLRYLTVRVDELDESPSPVLSRKDRPERKRD